MVVVVVCLCPQLGWTQRNSGVGLYYILARVPGGGNIVTLGQRGEQQLTITSRCPANWAHLVSGITSVFVTDDEMMLVTSKE